MADDRGESDERQRVERFLAAFNAVDRALRERTGIEDHGVPFRTILRRFQRGGHGRGADRLSEFAELRNLLVHETLTPNGWLAVPSATVVAQIEALRDRLAGIPRADEAFRRRVETLAADTALADALRTARRTGYSQFPLLAGDGRVVGLLTDRAIARWWAARVSDLDPKRPVGWGADLARALRAATVQDAVGAEGDRATWALADGGEAAERVLARFVDAPELEAVLITDGGGADGRLLGIATHLDVVRFWEVG